ncbi:cation transporter [Corynebacterium frankenforstense]|nr:cation transporter [Corynebacterium frankenforstense]MDK6259115.1 cation transporter [Corynebacterium frankenforstense]
MNRRVRLIVAVTISCNVIEALISLAAGAGASSGALIAFGLDSVIEVASAVAVAWQFSARNPEAREKVTVRAVAVAFFALAAYVTVDSVLTLSGGAAPEHSRLGIAITVASILLMPALAFVEFRTGRELGSASVMADSRQLLLCLYLSVTVLVGLLANALLGWWWADPVAALVVAALAVREGVEAWREGELEAPNALLAELDE